jgi:DNA helicase-2/ATP-dependent DNA helicase PcrA
MTVHAAKGLEFKYVFITNLVDKRFPTIERREAILIPDPLIKEILPQGDIHLEEERRLFYVAITRAKQGLYFSWAPDYGGMRQKRPSRFLAESGLVEESKKARKQESKKAEGTEAGILDFSAVKKKKENGSITYRVPSYFSYTQLAAFSNCPYQYRFAHILKIPRRGKAQFSFGKTMHSTLQKLFELVKEKRDLGQVDLFNQAKEENKDKQKKVDISLEEILNLYDQNWIDDWYEGKERKEEYRKLGKEILKDFYKK